MDSDNREEPGRRDLGAAISEFCVLVEKEIAAFSRLLNALLKQQSLILGGNLDDLKENVTEQERLIAIARSLRKDRVARAEAIADTLSLSPGEVTLSKLVRSVGQQYATRLDELRNTLSVLGDKIHLLSRDNRFLIERSLDLVEKNLQILARVGLSDPFYVEDPRAIKTKVSSGLRLVDTRG